MKWFCVQDGAREHYAIPRALHRTGRLAGLFTEFWAGWTTRMVGGWLPFGPVRALAARCHPDLADAHVTSWNVRTVWERGGRRTEDGEGRKERGERKYLHFVEAGRRFAGRVRDSVQRRWDLGGQTVLFAYDTAALEVFEYVKRLGVRCVLGQMDPNRAEFEAVGEEERRWPGWALAPMVVPEEYCQRREREWAMADQVVVNSEFCRQGLVRQGVPEEKVVVIPLCYEKGPRDQGTKGPRALRASDPRFCVLFLGQVILRKGIQYLVEAARLMDGEDVRFDVVGPIGISDEAVRSAPRNVVFHGRANRDQAGEWYGRADVFVLPTVSDGFALTQLEAMAHGLPVIATPNCGQVVTDGEDGFIVPARDGAALARAIARYRKDPELRATHSTAGLRKAGRFTLERLAQDLVAFEGGLARKGRILPMSLVR